MRPLAWAIVIVVLAGAAFMLLRHKRRELVDFEVYRTAAVRALTAEPLYRPDDGHYQFKYLPAFALAMAPFAFVSKDAAEVAWFALSVGMLALFVRVCIGALPARRLAVPWLAWIIVLITGKFWVKELTFGQTNLLLGLLLIGAAIAAGRKRPGVAGALLGAAVFVKPYALVLVPWLLVSQGVPAVAVFSGVVAAGLVLPAVVYGWGGNVDQIVGWYRTVTDTTAPNLLLEENISLATMWAKWIGPGTAASALATLSAAAVIGIAGLMFLKRRTVPAPDYLECGVLMLLVPLLSPQGWDYVLLIGMPALLCLVDRFPEMRFSWRAVTVMSILLVSFTIYDLLGRAFYKQLMLISIESVAAVALVVCAAHLRWRALA